MKPFHTPTAEGELQLAPAICDEDLEEDYPRSLPSPLIPHCSKSSASPLVSTSSKSPASPVMPLSLPLPLLLPKTASPSAPLLLAPFSPLAPPSVDSTLLRGSASSLPVSSSASNR